MSLGAGYWVGVVSAGLAVLAAVASRGVLDRPIPLVHRHRLREICNRHRFLRTRRPVIEQDVTRSSRHEAKEHEFFGTRAFGPRELGIREAYHHDE